MQKVKLDFFFTTILVCLVGIGSSMIFSTTYVRGLSNGTIYDFIEKHFQFVVLGIIVSLIVAKIPYRKIAKKPYLYLWLNGFSFLSIILVLVTPLGLEINGAKRWLDLGILGFQPSELVKVTFVFTFAYLIYIKRLKKEINNFKNGLLVLEAYLFFSAGIVLATRHLSAAGIIILVGILMLWLGGLNYKNFILLFAKIGVAGAIGIVIEPYRRERVMSFIDSVFNKTPDVSGSDFQINQSLYALGSGEWYGLGLGMSRQKFAWLPENHTDFIFAILGEETGFIGVLVVICLFMFLIIRGLWIVDKAKDLLGKLIVFGVVSLIFVQASLNMAIISKSFPVTGIPLPFISYGGSSTVILFIGIGLIYNVHSQQR